MESSNRNIAINISDMIGHFETMAGYSLKAETHKRVAKIIRQKAGEEFLEAKKTEDYEKLFPKK